MPDKPDTWVLVLAWLSQHAPAFYAAGFAISISALRIVYGGGTTRDAGVQFHLAANKHPGDLCV